MAIASTDILFYYPAVTAEGVGHGGTSTASVIGTTKNALFDDVSGAEANAGTTDYRKLFIGLASGVSTQILSNCVIWIASTTPATNEEIQIITGTVLDSTFGTNVQSDVTGNTKWATPVAKSDGGTVGVVGSGTAVGIWLRRCVTSGAAGYADDACTIRIEGEA